MKAGKSGNERFSLDVDAGNNTEATRFFKGIGGGVKAKKKLFLVILIHVIALCSQLS